MSTAQVTACFPGIYVKNASRLHQLHPKPCVLRMSLDPCSSISLSLRPETSFGLKYWSNSKSRQPLHICFAGGEGMMQNTDESSPWKSLEKAMERFKGQSESIEDVLRQQLNKGEYYDGGDGGAKPPGGEGGGGGGSPGDSDGPEDGSSEEGTLGDSIEFILATFGFIFMYIYILAGAELTKLARDYIKYLFGRKPSVRLRNAMEDWGELYQSLTQKVDVDEYWLEKTILDTPTMWHDPDDYREAIDNYLREHPEVNVYDSDDSDDDDVNEAGDDKEESD
ncbi:uncharacterized protein LOC130958070 [Arachis stenosperma]|uniref:uncharacterized protein LOC130958070 n=1 Tax=Arachis stenosperma TaxID=217475 RepID=UPI0025AD1758|nr:uncharacterized protein LOC130958070 [Arachis stenosperma]